MTDSVKKGSIVTEYNPKLIEQKWQDYWRENKSFHVESDSNKEKYYALVEFPYPSGEGLHVGHPRPYTALDVVSRKRRMQGYNVLYPMGFDAFGLPAENYAIKNKVHPASITNENIAHFTDQLNALGFSFDWSREVKTIDPDYYKWTQWIFIQLFKNGMAYKKEFPINWCPSCKIGLANEEVVGGNCERCGNPVEHKVKNQWMLKITVYADRLIDDLDEVDYQPRIKQQQRNWIGRSYGAEVIFALAEVDDALPVYTTRPDTLYGATYMVIAPEHPLIEKYADRINNMNDIQAYQQAAQMKSDFERGELNKDKSGVQIDGLTAINPASNEQIPIWISDYVLMSYGTGAIMAVPAHDSRDWEFAKKFNMPIIEVVSGSKVSVQDEPYTDTDEGIIVNSEVINGLPVKEAIEKMIEWLGEKGLGKKQKNFKLRDWVFSRQRYWGEPIPMVWCDEHGWNPVAEEELPVNLPDVENYEPSDDGESPLAKIDSFVNTSCPVCGGPARRETDTMPQWAGSSWYYLRYMDPHNDETLVSKEAEEYWGPVDWYNGGMEHTTLHLLYSRFWHKFLYDIGKVSTKEPYQKRTSHGMILGPNGEKMSKSRGNVINPDEIVRDYGADTLRTYEMFIGDFQMDASWTDEGLQGCRRFLDRLWRLQEIVVPGDNYSEDLEILFNQTIKKVTEDYESLKFNTAIAQLMALSNEIRHKNEINRKEMETILILLNPVAPHITEEMWQNLGYEGHIVDDATWPTWDESKLKGDTIEMPVQINGKVRATMEISPDASEDEIVEAAKKVELIARYLDGKTVRKVIYIPEKILNIVVG